VRAADPPARPAEIGARHLLVMYRGSQRAAETITRTKEEARTRATEALRRARAGEDWVALVREYTDEAGAPEGGDLGVFGHGAMVPAFERAAFALEVGAVSDVVESPFGFHVIQRYR
jgi:parvulin-like peptidyl-prolyl isomerase